MAPHTIANAGHLGNTAAACGVTALGAYERGMAEILAFGAGAERARAKRGLGLQARLPAAGRGSLSKICR
jgi:hypothetical protein